MTHSLKIYGASDDLVYVGDNEYDTTPYLLFSDGTQLHIEYGSRGVWDILLVEKGNASAERLFGLEDDAPAKQCHDDPDAPSYSDIMILTWDRPITLVKRGSKRLKAPPPDGSLDFARKVLAVIEKHPGGEHFIHELEPDQYNDLLDALAKLVSLSPDSKTQLRFCITGTLSKPREHFIALVEAAGHVVHRVMSDDTSYLVFGEANGGAKMQAAKRYGTPLLSEDQLIALLFK